MCPPATSAEEEEKMALDCLYELVGPKPFLASRWEASEKRKQNLIWPLHRLDRQIQTAASQGYFFIPTIAKLFSFQVCARKNEPFWAVLIFLSRLCMCTYFRPHGTVYRKITRLIFALNVDLGQTWKFSHGNKRVWKSCHGNIQLFRSE